MTSTPKAATTAGRRMYLGVNVIPREKYTLHRLSVDAACILQEWVAWRAWWWCFC